MIDSHCHLGLIDFDDDRQAVLERARAAGVTGMIDVGIGPASWERSLGLSQREHDVWPALGLHPNDIAASAPTALAELEVLLASEPVVAVGETGLDYHWQRTPREQQVEVFIAHLAMARRLDLPVIVHCRDAYDVALQIIAAHGYGTVGVMHCFGGSLAQAERALAFGYRVSVAGPVTFKSADALRTTIAELPVDAVLIETDSPYLTPHPRRGQRNEPAHVTLVAQAVAALRNSDLASVSHDTDAATLQLFPRITPRQVE